MLYGVMKDHTRFKTYNPETDYTALIGALEKNSVGIRARPRSSRISSRSCCCSWRRRCS